MIVFYTFFEKHGRPKGTDMIINQMVEQISNKIKFRN